jgi:hypothetical protein
MDNIEQSTPQFTFVQTRVCQGPERKICEWSIPGFHERFSWPFSDETMIGDEPEKLFGS